MKAAVVVLVLSFSLGLRVGPLGAQDLFTPPSGVPPVPLPAPPPPPSMAIPKVPKMGETPPPQRAAPRRGSFGDRVTRCIEEGAAMGLGPNERAAYSRACANSR